MFTPLAFKGMFADKTTVRELSSVMDISAEIPLHALTQEDTLSLWFKVLPMKQGCKGRAPSFWLALWLFPAMSGTEGGKCSNAAFGELKWGGEGEMGGSSARGGTKEDARLLFPCSPQPVKTLENGTFPSAKLGDTVTPGKAWVNTKGKAMSWAWGRGVEMPWNVWNLACWGCEIGTY